MAKARSGALFVAMVAFAGMYNLLQSGFVPPANRSVFHSVPAAAVAGVTSAVLGAAPALANLPVESQSVENAAKKFGAAAYPLMQEIDWTKSPLVQTWLTEAAWTPSQLATAIDKVLEVGMAMDPVLVKTAVLSHERALADIIKNERFIAPEDDVLEIFSSLAKAVGSAGSDKNMAVYEAFREFGGQTLGNDFMVSLGGAGEVGAAYKAFIDLVQVLQPIAPP